MPKLASLCLILLFAMSSQAPGPASWEGAYKLMPNAQGNSQCCFPISNLQINNVPSGLAIQGKFDSNAACDTAELSGIVFTARVSAASASSDSFPLSFTLDSKIENIGTLSYNNNRITYTSSLNSADCTAYLQRQGHSVGVQSYQWAGDWDVTPVGDADAQRSCCYPVYPLTITNKTNGKGLDIAGTFETGKTMCGSHTTFSTSVDDMDFLSSNLTLQVTSNFISAVIGNIHYQGQTATAMFSTNRSCQVTLTNRAYKSLPDFISDQAMNQNPSNANGPNEPNGPNGPTIESSSGSPAVKPWVIGVAAGLSTGVAAIGLFLLYKIWRAKKLARLTVATDSGYQQTAVQGDSSAISIIAK